MLGPRYLEISPPRLHRRRVMQVARVARLQLELEPDESQRLSQVALPVGVGRVARDGRLAEPRSAHARRDVLTPGLAARAVPIGRKALSCEVPWCRGAEVPWCGCPSPAAVKAPIASSKRCMLYMA